MVHWEHDFVTSYMVQVQGFVFFIILLYSNIFFFLLPYQGPAFFCHSLLHYAAAVILLQELIFF